MAGIHTPNNRPVYQEDIDAWVRINPGVILLCHPSFDLAAELKRRIPGVYIVGRVFGNQEFDAWHPRWGDADWMNRYGRYCGELANQYAIDAIQFANEPGIDDNRPGMWSKEGYEMQAYGSDRWLRGYRAVTSKAACTVPQSPGHLFDDDPNGWGWTGAGIVKDVWQQFDIHLAHAYITRDPATIESEWWGRRYRRERDALGWTKRLIVTETNRDEPTPPTDADRISLAENYRQWYANSEVESCFFIWDTADPNFARLTMKHNRWLIDVATHANAAVVPQEEPMPVQTDIIVTAPHANPVVAPGSVLTVSGYATGIDGQGMLTAVLAEDTRPGTPQYGEPTRVSGIPINGDGTFAFSIPVPNSVELPAAATLLLSTTEIDLAAFQRGAGWGDAYQEGFAVTIGYPAAEPEPAPVEASNDEHVAHSQMVIHFSAGDAYNRTGNPIYLDMQRAVAAAKEGRSFSWPQR